MTSTSPRVRVYIACSLDGFIAGPNDDLSWLPGSNPEETSDKETSDSAPQAQEGAVTYEEFIADVGALLMGRNTFDVVQSFGGQWPYGQQSVLVATHQSLETDLETVWPVAGDIASLIVLAKEAAGGKDVYVDGGILIRQALDAGLVDELIITLVPVILGEGQALFAGATKRHHLDFVGHFSYGDNMVQIIARPKRPAV